MKPLYYLAIPFFAIYAFYTDSTPVNSTNQNNTQPASEVPSEKDCSFLHNGVKIECEIYDGSTLSI